MLQLEARSAKAVGLDHIGTGSDIALCDIEDVGAVGEIPQLGALSGLKSLFVQEGTPGTVGDENLAGFDFFANGFDNGIPVLTELVAKIF